MCCSVCVAVCSLCAALTGGACSIVVAAAAGGLRESNVVAVELHRRNEDEVATLFDIAVTPLDTAAVVATSPFTPISRSYLVDEVCVCCSLSLSLSLFLSLSVTVVVS